MTTVSAYARSNGNAHVRIRYITAVADSPSNAHDGLGICLPNSRDRAPVRVPVRREAPLVTGPTAASGLAEAAQYATVREPPHERVYLTVAFVPPPAPTVQQAIDAQAVSTKQTRLKAKTGVAVSTHATKKQLNTQGVKTGRTVSGASVRTAQSAKKISTGKTVGAAKVRPASPPPRVLPKTDTHPTKTGTKRNRNKGKVKP